VTNDLDDVLGLDGIPDDGLQLMAELVAAVAWIRRGVMPGLTVWDAISMALAHGVLDTMTVASDPLRHAFLQIIGDSSQPIEVLVRERISHWLSATADLFNEGASWLPATRHRNVNSAG
jgi:hypothetical protein